MGKPLREPPWDMGFSHFRDINGDGFPDIYVCNDFQTPDRIWINDGAATFAPCPNWPFGAPAITPWESISRTSS